MLEAKSLSKQFASHRALDGLDLHVAPGETFCLLGANGAGKTTTIRLFLGLLTPTAGEALVDGLSVSEHPVECKRRTLYIPEQIALYPELTGLENLEYFAALSGVEDRSAARLRDCLHEAGLPDGAADRRAAQYSKRDAPEGRDRARHREARTCAPAR